MAKEREYETLEYDSITLTLPNKIRQGEHRRIERLVIQAASKEFKAIKDEVGEDFFKLGEVTDAANSAKADNDDEDMTDQEVQATLIVLCSITDEQIDEIDREDFLDIRAKLEERYKKKSSAQREVGKVISDESLTAE
jgi:hypothetical protein